MEAASPSPAGTWLDAFRAHAGEHPLSSMGLMRGFALMMTLGLTLG